MVRRGASVAAVRGYAKQRKMQTQLLRWLIDQDLVGLNARSFRTGHHVAATGSTVGGMGLGDGSHCVVHSELAPTAHPYDFAC